MSDHWYSRYPGDYGRDTAHLSLVEHGAYTLLLDHYYSTAGPLPADATALYRICRAFEGPEKQAVDSVLHQFFTRQNDGYHNSRADLEIVKRMEHHDRLSKSGKRGAEKRWDGQAIGQANGQTIASPQPPPQPQPKKEREEAQATPSPSVFTGQHFSVTQRQDALLGEAFPWVDRPAEYRKADSWMEANPEKRPKKKANRFLHNWFQRITQPKGKGNGKDINSAVEETMRGYAANSGLPS